MLLADGIFTVNLSGVPPPEPSCVKVIVRSPGLGLLYCTFVIGLPSVPKSSSTQHELASAAIPKSAALPLPGLKPLPGLAASFTKALVGSILTALSHSGAASHSVSPKLPPLPK